MRRFRGSSTRRWLMLAVLAAIAGADGTRAVAETIRGTVRDPEGKPAGGAIVWTARLFAPGPLDARQGESDPEGRFTLDAGPGRWFVWARRGTLAGEIEHHEVPEIAPGRDPAPVTIRLEPHGAFRGRLLEAETDRPIPGGRFAIDNATILTADAHGRFALDGLSLGDHEAYVIAPGRVRQRILFDTTLRPDAELELRLSRGGLIVGRVTDEQGRPIAGALVGYQTSGNTFSGTALWERCDPDGRFAWDGKEFDRSTRLTAQAPGYLEQERNDLRVVAGEGPLEVNFALKADPTGPVPEARRDAAGGAAGAGTEAPPREVSGVVRSPEGRPVARALVRWGANRSTDARETRTDADGTFRLARVPGRAGIVALIAPGLVPAFPRVPEGGDVAIEVALEKGTTVRGRVRDDTGAAIEGVLVLPELASPDPSAGRTVALWEVAGRTDAQGRFALDGMPERGVRFAFFGRNLSTLREQTLKPGGADNEVTMLAGGAIRGVVVDRDGHPVRNFRILLNAPRDHHPDDKYGGFFAGYCGIGVTFTSDDGRFVVSGVPAGNVQRVSALAVGHGEGVVDRVLAHPLNHLPPAEALTLRLGPPHALRVRAVAAELDGTPIAHALVTLVNGAPGLDKQFSWGYHDASWEDMVRARTDAQGIADFPALAFGEATVLVQAPGHGRRRLGWRHGEPELTVALPFEATVTGVVRDESGQPLSGVHVDLVGKSGDGLGVAIGPQDRGRFRLAELPEGEYTLNIRRNFGAELHQERIALAPGQVLDREIRVDVKAAEAQARQRALVIPAPPPEVVKVGDAAPAFAVMSLDDRPLKLEDHRGKYVLLDFWATWCGPCREETPHLKAVHDAFSKDDRFVMIGLSLDKAKDEPRAYASEHGMAWPQGFLGDWSESKLPGEYGVQGIPSIWLIGPDGKVIAKDLRGGAIKEAVARALEKP